MRAAGLLAVLALAACDAAPQVRHKVDESEGPLRAVYRSAEGTMVTIVPEKGHPQPTGDCGSPLFIDARTGAIRVLASQEVQARLKTMQLAGATRGVCPRP